MNYLKKSLPYFAAPTLALLTFFIYFNLWNADFHKVLFNNYEWDSLFHAFFVKTVIDNGWFMVNKFVGWPQLEGAFYLYDFPLEGSSFAMLLFKFFAFFSDNVFLVTNLYFFTTIILIALTTFIALRNFGISVFSALLIAVLYDLNGYHIMRLTFHCFLTNYMMIPLVVMVGFWIINDKIAFLTLNAKKQYTLRPNRFFLIAFLITALVATNDVYYAVYSCIFYLFAWFIRGLQNGKFLDVSLFNMLAISAAAIFVLLCLYMPSFLYWIENGANKETALRGYSESEYYALRVVDLLLPTSRHFIEYLANIRNFFNEHISQSVPQAYERESQSLGLLGSFGFVFLLFWLFCRSFSQSEIIKNTIQKLKLKSNDIALLSNLASLNLLSVLYATVGGFVMFMVPFFPMLRAHSRFSTFIAFISMLTVALIFDKFLEKNIFKRKIYAQIIILFIAILALCDQLGSPKSFIFHHPALELRFNSDKNFVEKIEANIPSGSRIFILPLQKFPEGELYTGMIGYLHSKNLIWSYPVMRNRPSAIWQKKVMNLEFPEFIEAIKKAGFNGIFIDRTEMASYFGKKEHKYSSCFPQILIEFEDYGNYLKEEPTKDYIIKASHHDLCRIKQDRAELKKFEMKLEKISKWKAISNNGKFSFYELES